ncbi:NAD(P)-dependent oxidoreductase [Streptococcus pluranimalium]|uniref:NAD(P)-dependent oxidoreductase n=1 Tax=Streptococcus pluranimalium TaxID=82348 RepID=UPI0039FC659C
MKVVCYGVRPNEVETFNALNKYDYELTLLSELLTHDNIETAKGHDAVLLRGNCVADRQNLEQMKGYGIEMVFTRTVGFDHIDLAAAKEFGQVIARVPGYSPNSVAELAFAMGVTLLRNVQYTAHKSARGDFRVTPQMFSREARNCTVGIIGTGRIGLEEAKMYKGMGAKVIGYDIFQSDQAKEVIEFVEDQEDLIRQSDIISIHVPYIAGENDEMINADFIAKTKGDAIIINTARGNLQNNHDVAEAIKSGQLYGFGADVLPNESETFFKKFENLTDIKDDSVQKLLALYPKVILTPHVGSNTDEALRNMVEISFDNFNEYLTEGKVSNEVK